MLGAKPTFPARGALALLLTLGGLFLGTPLRGAPGQPQPADYDLYELRAVAWSGSHKYWYSTFVRRSDFSPDEIARLDLRAPAATFPGWLWVNRSVRAHQSIPSMPTGYRGPRSLELFAEPPKTVFRETADGQSEVVTEPAPLGSVNLLPAEEAQVLIIRRSSREGPPQLTGLAIANGREAFPEGSIRAINLSRRERMALALGPQIEALPPRQIVAFQPGIQTGDNVSLRIADIDASRERPIYANMWTHQSDSRFLLLIADAPQGEEEIEIRVISGL